MRATRTVVYEHWTDALREYMRNTAKTARRDCSDCESYAEHDEDAYCRITLRKTNKEARCHLCQSGT